ncbi:MAG: translation elongation factor Ts [Phycisphaerae bacterium]|nr:translation elongation factor Ts [Phycisphaerae bacterium]MBN8596537.1 translation elongation factor Ts [Planctomycetota bacterium]
MAEINSKDVMALRNKTGLPMMACKAALAEAGGDPEKAEEILRKQLKGKMEGRTDRAAGEGRVGIFVNDDHTAAAIVEVRAESDFTAKNEQFVNMVNKVAKLAVEANAGAVAETPAIKSAVDEVRISTGENCSFARGHKLLGEAGKTQFGAYVHHDGKTGALVQAEGSISQETIRQVCMHIVAAVPRPQGVSANDVPAAVVEKERKFRIEQAMESGKPKEIAEKMVEGGMRKFFEEIALMEQPFIMDPTKKVKDLVGPKANIIAFFRWQVGESN